jgi:hypothetical protein
VPSDYDVLAGWSQIHMLLNVSRCEMPSHLDMRNAALPNERIETKAESGGTAKGCKEGECGFSESPADLERMEGGNAIVPLECTGGEQADVLCRVME